MYLDCATSLQVATIGIRFNGTVGTPAQPSSQHLLSHCYIQHGKANLTSTIVHVSHSGIPCPPRRWTRRWDNRQSSRYKCLPPTKKSYILEPETDLLTYHLVSMLILSLSNYNALHLAYNGKFRVQRRRMRRGEIR